MIIRVGDRFTQDDRRITVTGVSGDDITVSWLTDDGREWASRTTVKAAVHWTKVGSGPDPSTVCPSCRQEQLEPGEILCWTCMSIHAGEFAGKTKSEAVTTMAALIQSAEGATSGH